MMCVEETAIGMATHGLARCADEPRSAPPQRRFADQSRIRPHCASDRIYAQRYEQGAGTWRIGVDSGARNARDPFDPGRAAVRSFATGPGAPGNAH